MSQLELSNVIVISVSEAQTGISNYNTSNLAIFTSDTPDPVFEDGFKIYKEPTEVGVDFGTDSITYKMALAVFSQQPNILAGGGYLVVIPLVAGTEDLDAAITRTVDLVQYFGIMTTNVLSEADMLAAAAVVQALDKIAFFVQTDPNAITPDGALDKLRSMGLTHSRGLFYSDDEAGTELALIMQASYAGRGLSVNFTGSNTTITMHLKDLTGVDPDPGMTQTRLNQAVAAGADTYVSLQGVAKVFCSGANSFFDQIYNLLWFKGALQVSLFNYLAQSNTKIPQTESGMDGLKGSARDICEQARSNQYCAPGDWNSPTTFGNQQDLFANIEQRGYYIYSTPLSQQSQADREDRKAPLIQIALKEAGAIQSATVIVNINA